MNARRPRPAFLVFALVAVSVPVIACRKKPPEEQSESQPLTRSDCEAVIARAGASVGAAVKAANPPGRQSCAKDDDCIEVQPASCVKFCFGHGVPKSAQGPFSAAMRALEEGDCKRWNQGNCSKVAPSPTGPCETFVPRCLDGACRMAEPKEH